MRFVSSLLFIRRLARAASLSLALTACAGAESPVDAKAARPAAVVADISPGVNPYHELFRRPDWRQHPCHSIPSLPCSIPALDLTLGADYAASLEADIARGVWDRYQANTVYWVRGTNLLLLTTRSWEPVEETVHDGYGGAGVWHGVGSAAAVSNACFSCWLLVVQDSQSLDGMPVDYIAESLPWVDLVVSTNLADYGESAFDHHLEGSYAAATRRLYDSGRLFVAGAGNIPVTLVPPALTQYQLPPWVVSVGGAHYRNVFSYTNDQVATHCHAVETTSAKPLDLAGQFAQRVPLVESVSDYTFAAGTSFAAPQVAGAMAQVLAELRASRGNRRGATGYWQGAATADGPLADGSLSADELRAAAQGAARYFDPLDYNPDCIPLGLVSLPGPASPTPWVDMGWGYFGEDDIALAVAYLQGQAELPPKAETALYQEQIMALRQALFP